MNDPQAGWITEDKDGVSLRVLVVPKSSRSEIVGEQEDRLKIKIKAPPVDGAANTALITFLAKRLRLPKSSIRITAGKSGRRKTIRLQGAASEEVFKSLSPA